MHNVRILCIGNRFAYPDNFGMLIYDKLKKINPPYEIIEGGVGGMSLAPYFDDYKKILIIDYAISNKKILTNNDIQNLQIKEYNHSNAFLYLLKTIKKRYVIYTCNTDFNPENLDKYIEEILNLAKEMDEN